MTPLLPESPEEIRRIYRRLVAREALKRVSFHDWDEAYLHLARGIEIVALVALPTFGSGNPGTSDAFWTSLLGHAALVAMVAAAHYGVGRALLARRYGDLDEGEEHPHGFWALGPVSLLFLALVLPPRIAPESIDPYSLDVLEPVAREIATPLLAGAQAAMRDDRDDGPARVTAIEARIAELAREAEDEEEPQWRATIARRIEDLRARREEEVRRAALRHEARIALAREAENVERGLERLARRKRLLHEMRGDTGGPRPGADLGELRAGLAALGRTVAALEGDATARIRAEAEMSILLRGESGESHG